MLLPAHAHGLDAAGIDGLQRLLDRSFAALH
jgi:hypothetical protein